MTRLAPFRAVRYAGAAGDVSDLLAPPYDVIDAPGARRLRERSPFNAVRLVLPAGEVPGCYELAARRLRDWLRDGLIVRDEAPALWVYGQSFRHGGRELTRHGVFGALRLSPFEQGDVLPHEETHRGPKEDRLALMEACRAQLSPVFLVAPDPAGRMPALVDRATAGAPTVDARTPDGIRHRLWRVVEGPLAEGIQDTVGASPLLVADGHHRYETALELARGTPAEHPARRTLACVVGASDPGLLCLPTHRALARPPGAKRDGGRSPDGGQGTAAGPGGEPDAGGPWRRFLEDAFEVRELEVGSPRDAARAAAEAEAGMAVVPAGAEPPFLVHTEHAPDRRPAPVVFDRLVLRGGWDLGPDPAVERGLLTYHRDPGDAVDAAGGVGAAFLLPPPDVGAVWDAARRDERMPPKSTYFWPKLPSGLLFRLLEP